MLLSLLFSVCHVEQAKRVEIYRGSVVEKRRCPPRGAIPKRLRTTRRGEEEKKTPAKRVFHDLTTREQMLFIISIFGYPAATDIPY